MFTGLFIQSQRFLSMDPLKLMLPIWGFLVIAIFPATPILIVISTLIWVPWPQIFESKELFWNFQGLDFSSSVSYRLWNIDFTYPILSPSFFSFISLKFSVHGSAPTSYNLPPPLYYSLKSLDSASWYYSHHFCEYVHLPGLLLLPSKV